MRWLAVCAVAGVLAGSYGRSEAAGVDPVPLPITPLSTRLSYTGPHTIDCGAEGTSTASLNTQFGVAQVLGSAAWTGNELEVQIQLLGPFVFLPGPINTLLVEAVVQFDVPQLGGPTSPIYVSIDAPVEGPGGRFEIINAVTGKPDQPAPTCSGAVDQTIGPFSTKFGADLPASRLALHTGAPPAPVARREIGTVEFPAGDQVQLPISIHVALDPSGVFSSWNGSFKLVFRTVTPAIGTGDMNGDQSVNSVDSTILRRLLAGLPVN